jgi:predicted 3-demethylubiquinone-9 3-methyltransferase (glyoxalase superfamily)
MNEKIIKIQTYLWFNDQAEEAVRFYTSIFKNSSIRNTTYYLNSGQDIHGRAGGSVMSVEFCLEGQEFAALNGGQVYKLNEAVSIVVNCENQEELDYYWEKLSTDGDEESQHCGWLKDKYGLSWQIIPFEFYRMIQDADTTKAKRVMDAMFTMKKMDIEKLRKAYENGNTQTVTPPSNEKE